MKWTKWNCTNELKFEVVELPDERGQCRVLYQKWYREPNQFGSPIHTKRQYQWRPVAGQPNVTDILPGTADE